MRKNFRYGCIVSLLPTDADDKPLPTSTKELCEAVASAGAAGFQPIGNPSVCSHNGKLYAVQAVISYDAIQIPELKL